MPLLGKGELCNKRLTPNARRNVIWVSWKVTSSNALTPATALGGQDASTATGAPSASSPPTSSRCCPTTSAP